MNNEIDKNILDKIQKNFNLIETSLVALTARTYALEKAVIFISEQLKISATIKKNIEIDFLDITEDLRRKKEKNINE